jgi:predicted phosphodiesterase
MTSVIDFKGQSPEMRATVEAINLAADVKAANADDSVTDIVMVTHMSPRADIMVWKAGDHIWNALTPSYVNTQLRQVVGADDNRKIKFWVYGHTHYRQMLEVDYITYVNNARGYPNENPPFSLSQIEVGK